MKKLRCLLLTLALLAVMGTAAGAAETRVNIRDAATGTYTTKTVTTVNLVCDGSALVSDVPAFLVDGRTMVPVRVIAEQMGAAVTWRQETQQVQIENGRTAVTLTIGSSKASVDGKAVSLYDGVPATLVTVDAVARTMVPLRFVSDQLGAQITWDAASYTAAITTVTEQNYDVSLPAIAPTEISLQAAQEPKIFALEGRVIVDFPGGVLTGSSFGKLPVDGAVIKTVRYNQYDSGYEGFRRVARVVFDLNEGYTMDDLEIAFDGGMLRVTQPEATAPPELPPVSQPPSAPLVVLDAGHGGKDHGAIYNGISEKDIDLSITRQVGALLEQAGYRIAYSRTDDTYVTLSDRAEQANLANAAIFVSIHANAFPQKPEVNGLETYYLIGGEGSKKLAQKIQDRVLAATGANNRGIRTANFYVLKNTTMPAVLVETGYLTNTAEAATLNTAAYQALVAQGIANGVVDYLGPIN